MRRIHATKYISDADAKYIINEIVDAVMNCEYADIFFPEMILLR